MTEKKELNIYEKLAKIGKQVEVLKKSKDVSAGARTFTYVPEADILANIQGKMQEQNISLRPRIVPNTTHVTPLSYTKTRYDKNSKQFYEETQNEILVQAEMVFEWINNSNPEERVEVPWTLIGQQGSASQAFGSGLTYCTRYFMLKYFNAATDDDPDKILNKKRELEEKENKEVIAGLIEEIATTINGYLAEKPDEKKKMQELCTEFITGGNYRKINDVQTAAKLLEKLTEYVGGKENK